MDCFRRCGVGTRQHSVYVITAIRRLYQRRLLIEVERKFVFHVGNSLSMRIELRYRQIEPRSVEVDRIFYLKTTTVWPQIMICCYVCLIESNQCHHIFSAHLLTWVRVNLRLKRGREYTEQRKQQNKLFHPLFLYIPQWVKFRSDVR